MCDHCEWEAALETAAEIMTAIADIPERGEDFANSVEEKVTNMSIWIEDNQHVTEKMEKALDNMLAGALKWTE